MRRIFIDTSALIALKAGDDENHAAALSRLESALDGPPTRFVLTNYVLSELHAYFCRTPRLALEYVERVLEEPLFELVRAGSRDERRALEILRASSDKTYSFADAVSFAVMERLGLTSAFAFDRHFSQRGHDVMP